MAVPSPRDELSSWKEIATYLGVGVRTAQVWEHERGLPVHRLPGPRAQVRAMVAELEAWKGSQPVHGVVPNTPLHLPGVPMTSRVVAPRAGMLRWYYVAAALSIVVLLAGVVFARLRGPNRPSSFRVEENTLIVAGTDGRELWRHTFSELLSTQAYLPSVLEVSPRAWFGDLVGDGRQEVLFVLQPRGIGRSCALYCFDPDGRERWHFVPGRAMSTRTESFVPTYRIQEFAVERVGHDQHAGIVVSSCHYLYYPSQLVLLDPNGKLLREYWHAGHLGHIAIGDPDQHGRNRIYLGGINNARRAATLVVLDADQFGGASVEDDPDYQFVGVERGRELARVLFPRSCMNQRLERYNGVANLWVRPGGITVDVHERYGLPRIPSILYELSPQLQVRTVTLGDAFLPHHALLHNNGDLDHAFRNAELDALHQIQIVATAAP